MSYNQVQFKMKIPRTSPKRLGVPIKEHIPRQQAKEITQEIIKNYKKLKGKPIKSIRYGSVDWEGYIDVILTLDKKHSVMIDYQQIPHIWIWLYGLPVGAAILDIRNPNFFEQAAKAILHWSQNKQKQKANRWTKTMKLITAPISLHTTTYNMKTPN